MSKYKPMNETDKKNEMTRYRTIGDIYAVVEDFERCVLPREMWTHQTYLIVIFWYLHKYSLPEARRRLRVSLKRYDFEHNVTARSPGAYSELLTVFWITVINNYLKKHKDNHSFVILTNNLLEQFDDPNLPLKICRFKRLSSNYKTAAERTTLINGNQEFTGEIR